MPCDPNDVECQACAHFEENGERCEKCSEHSEWLSPDDSSQISDDDTYYRWNQTEQQKEEDWDW